jgi:nicotinamide mononucleotide transporter
MSEYIESAHNSVIIKPIRGKLSYLGTRANQIEAAVGLIGATVITILYYYVARHFGTYTTQLEIWSLITSLACVWLVRTENVWTMPIGIISCALMGVFFFNINLVGQAWLQIAFYIPIQLVGWWTWCRAGVHRTELPPTRLSSRGWLLSIASGLLCWVALWAIFHSLYGVTPFQSWDSSVVAASIVAQMLMTWKKAEHWLIWLVPVNVSAIFLYGVTHAWAFSFLYTIYLINAWSGWRVWLRTIKTEEQKVLRANQ